MGRVELTTPAEKDLLEIWEYVAEDSRDGADQLLQKLHKAVVRLAEHPELGESQPAFRESLRRFIAGRYLIFYLPLADGVRVIRVLHGSRRFEELL